MKKKINSVEVKDQLAIAIASDISKNCILINFGEQVSWIALPREAAEQMRDMLTAKILELPMLN
jgi:hypothetical protein